LPTPSGCLPPFLAWLLDRHAALGGVSEVRILGRGTRKGVWSAYATPADLDAVVQALQPVAERPRERIPSGEHPRNGEANIYFGLQAVTPAVDRVWRGFRRARSTTRDRDVLAYCIMAVDIDPERQPRGRSATDAEKAEALAVAERVRAWLLELGAESMVADSGNGYHLLIPIVPAAGEDLPQAARDAKRLLRELDRRFSTPGAKVDTSTFNPSRILKLYGTLAVKGEATAEHPHRPSSIDLSSIPEDVDLFARLASLPEAGAPPPTSRPASPPAARSGPGRRPEVWVAWRGTALDALPLEEVYGEWLTGRGAKDGWLQCRDPESSSGDRNPSAGVADGSGQAERGAFHSFRTGETTSVFDFLLRLGRASDFQQACALVAELSGVPLPEGPLARATGGLTELQDCWPRLAAGQDRNRALRATLTELVPLPAIEQQQGLERLKELTGLPMGVLRRTLVELRQRTERERKAKGRATPPAPVGVATVEYVQNRDTVEGLFEALLEAVRPAKRFFRMEGELVFIQRGHGPVGVNDRNLGGLLSAFVELAFMHAGEDGDDFLRYGVLPADLCRAFVSSPRVHTGLPTLRMYARAPVFDTDWNFVARPGFHEPSGIFYDGPAIEPTEGVEAISHALRDFHWKGEPDLVNFVGALLTALTMPHWGRGHPFLAINGNKPGVGKSTLARVLGVIAEGHEPSSVSFTSDDAELEKQLATRVEAGDRVLVIDNAKTRKGIQSPVLERCITDTRLNFRRLGSNTAISRPHNDVLFCLTMNLTQLGPDLRRRALPINLDLGASVRQTTYRVDDLVGWVIEHRLEVVAELAGMVVAWLEAGRPQCDSPAKHSTSQKWAHTIDAILRLSGFDGFLTNFEESEHAFDPRYELMAEIARERHGLPAATAANWVPRLATILEDRFQDRRGNPKSARARSTIVGSLFTEYLDTSFVVDGRSWQLERSYPGGSGRPPVYRFQLVEA
jgi:hypothetical protein